ncbi:hypothetical protein QJS10_CPB04g00626 [Acorus calamus]|uniref:YqaJ viral recombinase domain-containing protein n=1 Tax=Acorus calamus TaxID=4465 RepID=A0AAV9F198_ACOCL|nr:hypothetical protein QJS10_CPB04g00626 [Acorus calamus]
MLEPFSGNLATCWSNIQEEVALERYSLITGNIVSIPTFKIYDENDQSNDWLGASPDALVDSLTYGLPSNGVLEIKCPFFDGEVGKAKPWSQVSFHCMPQAQGLMEILDRDWMDFYCWTPNGSSLFRLHRDKQYWELMKLALSDFWWKHVQPAIEMRSANMTSEMRSLEPAPTHELCGELVCASNCMIRESTLLVREIHGKLQI